MELNLSLKEIYESFECEEFNKDLNKLDEIIEDIKRWCNKAVNNKENAKRNLENYIMKFTIYNDLSMKLFSFVNLTISADTQNKTALKYCDILERKFTELVESSTKFEKYISEIEDIDSILKDIRNGILLEIMMQAIF